MTRIFNYTLKKTFQQYNFPSPRPQSTTVTKVQNLCNSLSRVSSTARNPSGLLKTSYSPYRKGIMSFLSGLIFSSYLGLHQPVVLCAPKDTENNLENLPSEIHGYTRKELKEKKPNLFKYFYTEGFKERETARKVDLPLKAKAFQELLEMGEEVVKKVEGKDVCIVLGDGGSGKSTLISWLTGSKMKREKAACKKFYVYDVDPSQTTSPSTRISHVSSGTSIPVAAQKDSLTLVDMPGMDDTRSEWITIVNSILLEKIINTAKSVSFVITVGDDAVTASRGTAWKKNLTVIVDSLGYRKKEINGFRLDENDQSPIMILVNSTKNNNSIETPTDEALERAKDLLNIYEFKP